MNNCESTKFSNKGETGFKKCLTATSLWGEKKTLEPSMRVKVTTINVWWHDVAEQHGFVLAWHDSQCYLNSERCQILGYILMAESEKVIRVIFDSRLADLKKEAY